MISETKVRNFRFTYFTNKYQETVEFYLEKLRFELSHSWNRSNQDKGSLFRVNENSFIEVLHHPKEISTLKNPGLDHRTPQGVFMCIQIDNIESTFNRCKELNLNFKQEIKNQTWGHRSFTITEPNGIALFFYEELF